MTYRRVVTGTDGSPRAEVAVRHAAGLAAAFGAELIVVAAFPENTTPDTARALEQAPEEVRWRVGNVGAAEQSANAAVALAKEAGVKTVRTVVEPGDPSEVIIQAAEDWNGDVIVVGNKGMASATRFLLGSVPNKVSHHAPCDILIVDTGANAGGVA